MIPAWLWLLRLARVLSKAWADSHRSITVTTPVPSAAVCTA
jgi:hypothetical protein